MLLDEQAKILLELLQLYYPNGAKVIDLTFGKGKFWSEVFANPALQAKYPVTACDASPDPNAIGDVLAVKKNLFTDDYENIGLHDCALYDPPYLVQRASFDYGDASSRSWAASDLEKFTSNKSVELFNYRVECLKQKAHTFLKPHGLLLVKVLDPRVDGKLIPHHLNTANILSDTFELIDIGVYIRLGASTWKIRGNLHNLHGYWMTFRFRDRTECFASQRENGSNFEHIRLPNQR